MQGISLTAMAVVAKSIFTLMLRERQLSGAGQILPKEEEQGGGCKDEEQCCRAEMGVSG